MNQDVDAFVKGGKEVNAAIIEEQLIDKILSKKSVSVGRFDTADNNKVPSYLASVHVGASADDHDQFLVGGSRRDIR